MTVSTRVAIYARVSSAAQRDAHTIDGQLLVLRRFVSERGWQLVETYLDDGRSAKTGMLELRDGFARCIRDAEQKRFDVLVVVDVDRLTRTDDLLERAAVLGPFQRAGVRIVTPSSEIDLRTMFGQLDVTLRALYAAEENRKRGERIKAGKVRALSEGRKPAGPTPYGWTYSRAKGEWSIDEPAAAILREIFKRVAGGESCVQIADDLIARDAAPAPRMGWTRAAVYRIVRSRTPVGEWIADKRQRVSVAVPPLITEKQWQAAAAALFAHKKRGLRRTRHVYLLEGLGVCDLCGGRMHIRSSSPARNGYINPPAYVCESRKLPKKYFQRPSTDSIRCTAPITFTAEADRRVWALVERVLGGDDLVKAIQKRLEAREANRRDWDADAKAYRARLERLQRTETAILSRFRKGTISEGALDRELAELHRERESIEAQLRVAHAAVDRHGSTASAADIVAGLRRLAANAAPADRQRIVRAIVPKAVFRANGKLEVVLEVDEPGAATEPSLVRASGSNTRHEELRGKVRLVRVA